MNVDGIQGSWPKRTRIASLGHCPQTTWQPLEWSMTSTAIRESQDPQRPRSSLSRRPRGPGSLTSPGKWVSSGDSLDKSTCLQLFVDMFHVKHRERGVFSEARRAGTPRDIPASVPRGSRARWERPPNAPGRTGAHFYSVRYRDALGGPPTSGRSPRARPHATVTLRMPSSHTARSRSPAPSASDIQRGGRGGD